MLKKIKYIIKDFCLFLKNPSNRESEKLNFFYYVMAFAIVILVAGIIRIGVPIIFTIFDVPTIPNKPSDIQPIPIGWFVLLATFIAPLSEELAFRYPLKYTKNSLFIGFVAFIFINFVTNQYAASKLVHTTYNFQESLPYLLCYFAIALLIFILTRFEKINKYLSQFWNKYLIFIVYIFAAYFAYRHMPIPKTGINWLWLPILVFPQFLMALYFSYIRLRVKFIYCIFLHMIVNGFTTLPLLLNI